jgi:hypothetical protein
VADPVAVEPALPELVEVMEVMVDLEMPQDNMALAEEAAVGELLAEAHMLFLVFLAVLPLLEMVAL